MSQYYSMKIGNIHDEDYKEWLEMCKKLKSVGLLDEYSMMMDGYTERSGGTMWLIFQAFLHDDPNPERYLVEDG